MRLLLLCLPAVFLITSCGNLQNLAAKSRAKRQQKAMDKLAATSSEEASARLGAKALGEIAYVDDAEQFVLIRTLNGVQIPGSAGLETRQAGKRTALLRATTERKNEFTAADLLEGQPQAGEGVFASTAKPKPKPARPAGPAPTVATPNAVPTPAAPTFTPDPNSPPGLPFALPMGSVSGESFDPTNLPPLQDPIVTPEDLKR